MCSPLTISLALAAQLGTAPQAPTPTAGPAQDVRSTSGIGVPALSNVLVIVADDVGVDMVAAYQESSAPAPTPVIDSLAANGVLFRNAWANPVCSPSRACIQTGRYGFRYGLTGLVTEVSNGLPVDEVTIPEMLDAGTGGAWDHAAIGKWHLGNNSVGGVLAPNFAGWGHYHGNLGNFSNEFDYFHHPVIEDGAFQLSAEYATTYHVDSARAWIREAREPWVCHLAFNAAHTPFHIPPLHLVAGAPPPHVPPHGNPTPWYAASIEAMDTEIGRLLNSIDPAVLARTTILLVGDNGTPVSIVNPPFVQGQGKLTMFERGLNVPFIVSGPLVNQPGREEDALVHLVDIFATIADIAHVDLDHVYPRRTFDSVSVLPYLVEANADHVRGTVYAEMFFPEEPDSPEVNSRAIRGETFKLIRDANGIKPDELYHLGNDPFEQNDLFQAPLSQQAGTAHFLLSQELDALLSSS